MLTATTDRRLSAPPTTEPRTARPPPEERNIGHRKPHPACQPPLGGAWAGGRVGRVGSRGGGEEGWGGPAHDEANGRARWFKCHRFEGSRCGCRQLEGGPSSMQRLAPSPRARDHPCARLKRGPLRVGLVLGCAMEHLRQIRPAKLNVHPMQQTRRRSLGIASCLWTPFGDEIGFSHNSGGRSLGTNSHTHIWAQSAQGVTLPHWCVASKTCKLPRQ